MINDTLVFVIFACSYIVKCKGHIIIFIINWVEDSGVDQSLCTLLVLNPNL